MDAMSAVSGPATTEELIQRCRSASNVKEQIVLRELVTSMIYTFEEQPLPSFMPEVVQLASIATDEEYRTIIATFANRIIHGTADGDVLSPKLLLNFTRVLRRAPDVLSAETAHLGSVLDSLRERLEKAAHRAEVATQYHLCRVLSRLLDAMLDIKITGLNREYLHQPLLLKLRGLQNNQEPRLAEAAGYAYQGLLSISNDEGTFEAFWRHTGTLVLAASKIAGAVPTLDPSKIFDATPEVMNLLSTISSMVGGVQRIYSASQESKDVVEALRALSRQEGWYVALRYSEILLTAGAYQMLEDFIQRSPCYDMERFWSGLLAQLERAWVGGSSHTKGSVKRVIEIAIPLIKAKYGLAQRWIGVVADTLDQPTWRPEPVDVRHKIRFWKNDDYNSGNLLVFSAVDSSLQADPSKLLLKALPGCEEAMRFYVDSELRRQYTKGGLLEIKRLSGELLDMEQCYINLTLVEHSGGLESGQKDKNQASAFTLFSRLQVGPDAADQNVPLPSIFKARRLLDGTKIHPRRILIRGRAGVGKTTLCKKIVHDFLNGQLWGDHFDRLIWIPLRSLKSKASPKELLQDYFKYCPSQLGSESLVSALWASMFGPNNAQTLLLLDGLDEISDERSSGAGDMTDSLKDLLNYSNVIITSRPSAVGLPGVNQFDLELETVGFQQNQVTAYLNKVVVDSTKRKEMQEFINQHCLIQGLIQIPIQLDALCYSWDDELRKKDMPKTMTALYQAIEHNLWKKDVLRLEKRNERVLLSENQTQKLRQRSQLQAFVGREMEMLELFAFTGLQNDIIEFSPRHRDRLYENSGILGMSDDILDGSSFLRTSDLSKRASTTYHFLHLTFQEFFAAQYFVRCWVSGQDITLLSLRASQKAATTIAPDKLVEEEKYNGRYDIFWRFVAGLLYFKDTAQLYRFFQKIEEKPHDMLGPSHLRLLMHCFSEVPCSDQKLPVEKIRKKLEDRCLQWTNWECSTFGYFALCKETEFPDSVVFQILAEQPYPAGKTKLKLFLSALGARNQQPSVGIQELVWDILRQDPPWEIKRRCLVVISPQTSLPNKILDDLVSMLTDSDPKKRRVPFSILGTVPEWPLSEQVEAKMVHCLSDTDAKVRTIAYDFLQSWPERPMRFIDTIGAFLEDPAVDVRCLSALLLANVSTLPENTMESLLPTLAMSDSNTKQVFLDVLESDEKKKSLSVLPEETINFLSGQLKTSTDQQIRQYSAAIIATQCGRSAEAARALLSTMTDHDPMIRKHAYRALRESPLREEYLSDQNASHAQSSWSVGDNLRGTQSDATTFAAYPSIPKFSLDTLLGQLEKHSDADVRESAAKSIGTHYHLTDRALDILESGLGDPAMNVKDAVARILEKQSNLPDRILTALSSRLERDMGTRKSPGFWPTSTLYYTDRVTDILNGQKYLPESILLATVAQLKRGTGSTFGGLEQILWKHDYLSYLLRDTDALRYVYRDWIHRSMIQQLACYVKDDGLHVIAMHGRKVLSSPLLSASDIRMILFDETSAIESPATRWYTIC